MPNLPNTRHEISSMIETQLKYKHHLRRKSYSRNPKVLSKSSMEILPKVNLNWNTKLKSSSLIVQIDFSLEKLPLTFSPSTYLNSSPKYSKQTSNNTTGEQHKSGSYLKLQITILTSYRLFQTSIIWIQSSHLSQLNSIPKYSTN